MHNRYVPSTRIQVATTKRLSGLKCPHTHSRRYVGGTWRVGGLLALSRAFGDAYLKGSLQFEGLMEGSDGYSSGFGVIAEPYTTVTELTAGDSWLVVASDGLFAEVERGGGGGLDNAALTELLQVCACVGACVCVCVFVLVCLLGWLPFVWRCAWTMPHWQRRCRWWWRPRLHIVLCAAHQTTNSAPWQRISQVVYSARRDVSTTQADICCC